MSRRLPRVLIVCTGNTCRSPMAAALLLAWLGAAGGAGRAEVRSAGTEAEPFESASPGACAALAERGIDLSTHRAARLDGELVRWADVIWPMTGAQREVIVRCWPWSGARLAPPEAWPGPAGDVPDPIGRSLDAYRGLASDLAERVAAAWIFERITPSVTAS